VVEASLPLCYHFFINSVSGASRRLSSSVSPAIRFLFLDLTCFIADNVHSHTYVFSNIECIFSAKSFSLKNLSLLSNFENVSAVSNTVVIVHFY